MSLTRTTSGLLARFGGASYWSGAYPFATTGWTLGSGLTLALPGPSGPATWLYFAHASGTPFYAGTLDELGSRTKTLVYMSGRRSGADGWIGPIAHVNDVTTTSKDLVAFRGSIARGAGERLALEKWVANTPTQIDAGAEDVGVKAIDTDWPFTLFADEDTEILGYDHGEAKTKTATLDPTYTSGSIGVMGNGATSWWLGVFVICTDRYVTITDAPSGATGEIQNAAGTLQGSAGSESSGTITIDVLDIKMENAVKVVIKSSGGATLSTFEDETGGDSDGLIAGGDVFQYVEDPAASWLLQRGRLRQWRNR